ncbi:uncharacterized protein, partial [Elaeis guineensis]|uniref:Uncharacterized protein LOC105049629 n=1 Tax=Elaeis guineensis var. tenera TaxID=51953 RepID=A0A8N4F7Z0_ELAGV
FTWPLICSISHHPPPPSIPFFYNFPLISSLVAFAVARSARFLTIWYKEKQCDAKKLVGSGGMPSSRSATVAAFAAAIGFQVGFGGSSFATAMTLACVVMYDAFGVRLHAGSQAEVCLLHLHLL